MAQSVPELVRCDLTATVLQLKALGIDNILAFDWIDAPPEETLTRALEMLYALQAIDENGQLTTPIGLQLAELPIEPQMGRALLAAVEMGCADDVVTIAACTSVDNIWYRDRHILSAADFEERKKAFSVWEGDLISYLNIYLAYKSRENPHDYDWFSENGLSRRALARVDDIRNQLMGYLTKTLNLKAASQLPDIIPAARALTTGFFANAAYNHHGEGYCHVRQKYDTKNNLLHIHPSSVLYAGHQQPPWVIFISSIHSDRKYIRDLLAIEFDWLFEVAPSFYQKKRMPQ